ncbi:biotin/lipoyl-binding protein [Clostridium sediminicola]|uniref:biotin/lipoyl-containing protein n=1 Tax=Clostridium sediminicola TaxID=3114879 RepID=UPI0031F1DEB7
MKYIATLNGKKYEIEIEKVADYQPLSRQEAVAPVATPAPVVAPTPAPVAAPAAAPVAAPAAAGETTVTSPMPGSIFDIKVAEGQTVKTGQVILVLEAMKMENEIVATADGTVSLSVKKGDAVDTDAVLAVIK